MKICGLVQARMGSSRLPGKVMKSLSGRPLVGHIFDRLRAVSSVDGIVLATTQDTRNEPLVAFAESEGVAVYRHHEEDDIVGRLVAAAKQVNADALFKVNADCPLIDPDHIKRLIDLFVAAAPVDFASNKLESTYPLGYSLELVSTEILEKCEKTLKTPEERELVIQWIMDNREHYKTVSMTQDVDQSHLGLAVDTPEDFELIEKVFSALYENDPLFGMEPVLSILDGCIVSGHA